MNRPPIYRKSKGGRGIVVLAATNEVLDDLDTYMEPHLERGLNIVVLVGDSVEAAPLKQDGTSKVAPGNLTAPPAWEWIRENAPYVRDCIFIP